VTVLCVREDNANSRPFSSRGGLSAALNPRGEWELGRSRAAIRRWAGVISRGHPVGQAELDRVEGELLEGRMQALG
jgi:hypothetical protein